MTIIVQSGSRNALYAGSCRDDAAASVSAPTRKVKEVTAAEPRSRRD
jgi:hypothetical protein